jgi:hypothetical protein
MKTLFHLFDVPAYALDSYVEPRIPPPKRKYFIVIKCPITAAMLAVLIILYRLRVVVVAVLHTSTALTAFSIPFHGFDFVNFTKISVSNTLPISFIWRCNDAYINLAHLYIVSSRFPKNYLSVICCRRCCSSVFVNFYVPVRHTNDRLAWGKVN